MNCLPEEAPPAQTDKSRPNCDLQKAVTKGQSDVCKKSWGQLKPKGFTTQTQAHKSHARQAWIVALTNGWHFWCISCWGQNLKKKRMPIYNNKKYHKKSWWRIWCFGSCLQTFCSRCFVSTATFNSMFVKIKNNSIIKIKYLYRCLSYIRRQSNREVSGNGPWVITGMEELCPRKKERAAGDDRALRSLRLGS